MIKLAQALPTRGRRRHHHGARRRPGGRHRHPGLVPDALPGTRLRRRPPVRRPPAELKPGRPVEAIRWQTAPRERLLVQADADR